MKKYYQLVNSLLLIGCLVSASLTAQTTFTSNTEEASVPPYTLPDVLKKPDGKPVTNAAAWAKIQRPYLYHLYEQYQFGKYPTQKNTIRPRLLEADKQAFDGLATRKQVRIYLHPTDSSVYTDLLLYIPNNAKKPAPVFLGYNFSGNHIIAADPLIRLSEKWVWSRGKGVVNNRATDAARGIDSASWQVLEVLSHGYALATAYYGDIEPDTVDGWKTGIRTTLKEVLKIQPTEWCAMGAWAWGLSRIYDYLQNDPDINASKVALVGHSRLGKAVLWAAASDQRFSLIISNESGEGGAALSKRWYGETVQIITTKFPHWFAPAYATYGNNVAALPVDGHMLLSLVAPRPLYVASAVEDTWSDPYGEFLSAREAGKVYALFGKKGMLEDRLPPLHHPVGNTVRYHIRAGKHAVTGYDWQQYLQFAGEQWK